MPRKLDLEALEAELAALSGLLAEAREVDDPVGVVQYEQRKQQLEAEIQSLREAQVHQASLALYFGGDPVFGSRGIAADFAGKALERFQEIVGKQFAAADLGSLGQRGPVPLGAVSTLMVTGVTHGSFGFLLDELSEQSYMFDTALKEMVSEVLTIMECAGSADETAFEDAAETLDPRTLMALREFFVDLDSDSATVRLVDDTKDLALDAAAVHRARLRTEATEINEEDKELPGVLIGFLPDHRRFELRSGSGEVVYGSATKESAEQFMQAVYSGRPAIGKECVAKVTERTVRPLNRPPRLVYRLLEFVALGGEGE
jgi:hypothetical protein